MKRDARPPSRIDQPRDATSHAVTHSGCLTPVLEHPQLERPRGRTLSFQLTLQSGRHSLPTRWVPAIPALKHDSLGFDASQSGICKFFHVHSFVALGTSFPNCFPDRMTPDVNPLSMPRADSLSKLTLSCRKSATNKHREF